MVGTQDFRCLKILSTVAEFIFSCSLITNRKQLFRPYMSVIIESTNHFNCISHSINKWFTKSKHTFHLNKKLFSTSNNRAKIPKQHFHSVKFHHIEGCVFHDGCSRTVFQMQRCLVVSFSKCLVYSSCVVHTAAVVFCLENRKNYCVCVSTIDS